MSDKKHPIDSTHQNEESLSAFVEHMLHVWCNKRAFNLLDKRLKNASEQEKKSYIDTINRLESEVDIQIHTHNSISILKLNTLGLIYHYGIGMDPNPEKAYNYLKIAATQDEIHMRKEMKALLVDLKKDADNGNCEALFDMANIYEHGLGPKKDLKLAFHYYQQAAEKGYADAVFKMGVMYAFGHGVEADCSQAANCFRKAYESGNLSEKYHPYLIAEMKQLLHKINEPSARYTLAVVLKDGRVLNDLAENHTVAFKDECKHEIQRILPLLDPRIAHTIFADEHYVIEVPIVAYDDTIQTTHKKKSKLKLLEKIKKFIRKK